MNNWLDLITVFLFGVDHQALNVLHDWNPAIWSLLRSLQTYKRSVFVIFTGGLLRNIEFFRNDPVDIIIDLQRNGDQANTLGEYLKIPVVTMVPQSKPPGKYTISIYPSIFAINNAIIDVLLKYKITESILLYDGKIIFKLAYLTGSEKDWHVPVSLPTLPFSCIA